MVIYMDAALCESTQPACHLDQCLCVELLYSVLFYANDDVFQIKTLRVSEDDRRDSSTGGIRWTCLSGVQRESVIALLLPFQRLFL